jgi:AcrR family transcriptional regulator
MQVPKEHVRARFVAAAAASFAELGYDATTMAGVAERAGSSVGNLYKYFDGKEALFAAAVPHELVTKIRELTRARIEALGTIRDVRLVAPDARYHVIAGELLDLCLANREAVVVLLGRPEGTPFASFPEDFTERLVGWALDYVAGAWPTIRPTPEMRFVLRRIYRNYLAAIADAFVTFRDVPRIREAVEHLTAHHQGGLKHLFETAARAAEKGNSHHDAEARRAKPPVHEPAPHAHPRGAEPRGAGAGAPAARARKPDRAHRPRGLR